MRRQFILSRVTFPAYRYLVDAHQQSGQEMPSASPKRMTRTQQETVDGTWEPKNSLRDILYWVRTDGETSVRFLCADLHGKGCETSC